MPHFPGRHGKAPRRRPNVPSLRIRTHRPPESERERPETPAEDPLDQVEAVQPTDMVPHATAETGAYPAMLSAPDDPPVPQEPSLGEYIERIEASAARLRAEHGGEVPAGRVSTTAAQPPRELPAERSLRRRRPGRKARRKRAAPPDKPWYRRRRTWFLAAVITPLLIVAGTVAYGVFEVYQAYDRVNVPQADFPRWEVNDEGTPVPVASAQIEETLPDWSNDEPVNIVLLGVDAETAEDQPPRSDTAIVVQVNPATEAVTMMSIPRDLMVFIPGYGENKFNAAYPIGEVNRGDDVAGGQIPGGGPSLVAQTIGANFDIQIHYFVTIDFDGFREVIDTVGGVVVDVETQLTDNLYPTDDLRVTRVYFPSGIQKMDGDTALQYVRTRHADSDFGRAERQQQVLMALREQVETRDLFTKAQALLGDLQDTFVTDLKFNEMLALANLGRGIAEEDIARFSLWDGGLLTQHFPESETDPYYLEADWDAVRAETRARFGGEVPVAEDVSGSDAEAPDYGISVFVENATDIPQLAGSSSQLLADAGFVEVWPSDARSHQSESTIRVAPGQVATAAYIAELLGFPEGSIQTVTGTDGITVTLGDDVPPALIPNPDDEPVAG